MLYYFQDGKHRRRWLVFCSLLTAVSVTQNLKQKYWRLSEITGTGWNWRSMPWALPTAMQAPSGWGNDLLPTPWMTAAQHVRQHNGDDRLLDGRDTLPAPCAKTTEVTRRWQIGNTAREINTPPVVWHHSMALGKTAREINTPPVVWQSYGTRQWQLVKRRGR